MRTSAEFEFDDLQALVRYGHGKLSETCFMLLDIVDADAAKKWLVTAPVTPAVAGDSPPSTALQVAFSVDGLRVLGLGEGLLDGFSSEFNVGLAGDESRSRRLGDVGRNAPEQWEWGGVPGRSRTCCCCSMPHKEKSISGENPSRTICFLLPSG